MALQKADVTNSLEIPLNLNVFILEIGPHFLGVLGLPSLVQTDKLQIAQFMQVIDIKGLADTEFFGYFSLRRGLFQEIVLGIGHKEKALLG